MIGHDPALDDAYGAQVWAPQLLVSFLDPSGVPVQGVSLVAPSGVYANDAGRWPRQTCELVIPTALTPDRTTSPVSPYGGTVTIDVGARFLGVSRTFRLATLDVTQVDIDRPAGTITVQAASHEARVDEDRVESRSSTSAGTATALITFLVRRTLGSTHPVLNRVPPADDDTFTAGAFRLDGGVWATVEQIADAAGIVARFDASGALVLELPPKVGTPVITYRAGDGGSLTGYLSSYGWAHNRVAVRYTDGDDTTPDVVGMWQDTAASSPTRATGPYGRHTRLETVNVDKGHLPTLTVANRAAASLARRAAAGFRTVTLRTIPAPWIEPGDTARVELLGGLTETHLVTRHAFPLDQLDVAVVETAADDVTSLTFAATHPITGA